MKFGTFLFASGSLAAEEPWYHREEVRILRLHREGLKSGFSQRVDIVLRMLNETESQVVSFQRVSSGHVLLHHIKLKVRGTRIGFPYFRDCLRLFGQINLK